jgi:hypothetical protein
MKNTNGLTLLLACLLMFVGAGCTPAKMDIFEPIESMLPLKSTLTATSSATPDLCQGKYKLDQIEQITRLTRHFDDVSILAQFTPQEQLAAVVLEMQHIQHQAEDQVLSACLEGLRAAQLNYIRAVISTMTSFLQGVPNDQINAQINASRQIRQSYEMEKAAQLGIPYFTPTSPPIPTQTPVTPTATLGPYTATTRQDIYVLQGPAINFTAIDAFMVGDTVNVIGRLASSDWLMIETLTAAGRPGWVPVQLVTLNVGLYELPIVEAPPLE